MRFPQSVSDEVMVKCSRHCCLCGEYKGLFLQLHHIVPVAKGGDNSADNCIPLCPNCHAQVENYNPKHALVRKYTSTELKAHRDKCYAKYDATENEPFASGEREVMKLHYIEEYNSQKVCWGFIDQEKLCPLSPGMLVMVGGCTGNGKSTYVQNIVNFNLNRGKKTLYLCLKESPAQILNSIIAQSGLLDVEKVNNGHLTSEDWQRIAYGLSQIKEDDLKLLDFSDISDAENLIFAIEHSGAEIVVIDDLGGLFFEDNSSVERFMYRAKQAAIMSGAVVFIVCNVGLSRRMDKRPLLQDFPSDSFYRICDIVHLLFRPSKYNFDEELENLLEVIVVKNWGNRVGTIEMLIREEMSLIASYDRTTSLPTTEEIAEELEAYLKREIQ